MATLENRILMGKNTTFEVPPPGGGLVTVMEAVPALATSVVVMVALSRLLEITSVSRDEPFQFTTAEEAKPVPPTVSVNSGLPGWVLTGDSAWLRNGTGLDCAAVGALNDITIRNAT